MKISGKIKLIILFITITTLFCVDTAYAESFKLINQNPKHFKMAFIPDIHLSFEKTDGKILYKESMVIIQDIIKTINKTKDLNCVVFGGDLTDNKDGRLGDLPILLDVMSELKVPYFVISGDRDVDFGEDYTKSDFLREFPATFRDKEKIYWQTEPVQGIILIGLDTTIVNNPSGSISTDQLVWLEGILKENKDKLTIITMHHPAFPPETLSEKQDSKDFSILNSQNFLQIIKNNPQVKLIMSGHNHISLIKETDNTIFASSPSIVSYPNRFTLVTISDNKLKIDNPPISFKQIIKKAKKMRNIR